MERITIKPKKTKNFHKGILWLALYGIVFCSSVAKGSTQPEILNTKISISVEKESIVGLLEKIENRAEIKFAYSTDKVNLSERVTKIYYQQTIKNILNEILPNSVSYAVSGKNVVILKPKLKAQNKTIATGIVKGSVKEEGSGEYLPYATIAIKGTSKGGITNAEGSFKFGNMAVGPITLVASFVGFEEQEKEIIIKEGEEVDVHFQLKVNSEELKGVEITGMRKGEVKAISQMKSAENIKYVMSQEQIERFPDRTISESLQRVPGVAVGYSYGLPRDIIIRGLSQELSSITLNGTRLPSTSTGGRNTDLNGVLSNMVESIEVVKTLTPDLDADGTGGTVNIVTKQPLKNSDILDANILGGYNALEGKMDFGAGFTYGKRKNKVGFIVGANYLRSNLGEDRVEKGYDDFDINGIESERLEVLELTPTSIKRDNFGINAEIDYYPNDNTTYYFRASYNKYYEIQNRLRRYYAIGDYVSATQIDNITISNLGNWRNYNRDLTILSAGGETSFASMDVDFDLTYSKGHYDQPIYYSSSFSRSGLSGTLDMTNPIAPQINFNEVNPTDPTQFTTDSYTNRHDQSEDNDFQLTANASLPYTLGSADGLFKFGGRFKYKYNDRFRNYFNHKLITGEFNEADYLSDYSKDDFFKNTYVVNDFPEANQMEDYYQNNKELFIVNENYTRQNTDPDSYKGNEYLGAGYVMTQLNINALEIVAGVRLEQTGFNYDGNQVNFDENGDYISTVKVNTDKSFSEFFPSLNLKYSLSKNTFLRAAVTKSLSRPSYYDLVPWEEVESRKQRIKKGNPDLTQATSVNYDFLFDHYFKSIGLISAGVFYKSIEDYIYDSRFIQEGGEYDGWEIRQTVNGANASVKGIEIAWQQQLTFLPGFLNGLGVYANYTYVDSKIDVPGIVLDRTVKLPEMRPHVGNVALSYEKYGFSGRISMYFFDTYITELSDVEANDELENGRKQIDFSAAQKINNQWSIFMGINNITNAPVSYEFGDGRPFDDRYYSTRGTIGVRFTAN